MLQKQSYGVNSSMGGWSIIEYYNCRQVVRSTMIVILSYGYLLECKNITLSDITETQSAALRCFQSYRTKEQQVRKSVKFPSHQCRGVSATISCLMSLMEPLTFCNGIIMPVANNNGKYKPTNVNIQSYTSWWSLMYI